MAKVTSITILQNQATPVVLYTTRAYAYHDNADELEMPQSETRELQQVAQLFGGPKILRRKLQTPLDAHELLLDGLPGLALCHLVDHLAILSKTNAFERALGMSLRTFQRHKEEPDKPLSQEQSGRMWKFAEILAKATEVFGSQQEAEQWLERPAMGLNQHRPIDLLATPAGIEMVEDLLARLAYGVYV